MHSSAGGSIRHGAPRRAGGRIDSSAIDSVKNATDIVGLIGRYVQLKKSGRSFRGLCPFHSEKTPSFYVSPEKQAYHCFGCGAGGDAITFLMDYLNLSFMDALEELAEESGVVVTFDGRQERNDVIRDVVRRADAFFRKSLASPGGRRAMEYLLEGRSLSPDTIESLGLGWAPAGNQLTSHLRAQDISDSLILESGVAFRSDRTGDLCDRFRERVMFPIRNRRGTTVSFGGRSLEADRTPKYINGPDSPVYSKGHLLYGFREALEASRTADMVMLVEGYFDLARLVQAGFGAVVATCGTALTAAQARQLRGMASDVFVAYDGDDSGRTAAMRAAEILVSEGAYPMILRLEQGEDPDSAVLRGGAAWLEEVMGRALDPVSYYLSLESSTAGSRSEGRTIGLVRKLVELCGATRDPIVRETLLRKVSEHTGYSMAALTEQLSIVEETGGPGASRARQLPELPARDRSVLRAIISSPEGLSEPLLSAIDEQEDLESDLARAVVRGLRSQAEQGHSMPLLSSLSEDERAVCAMLIPESTTLTEEDRSKISERLFAARRKKRIAALRKRIAEASPEEKDQIVREIARLSRKPDDG
ncbi:DNA primase [Candidatus Fermentibacterales bacterium]|nr:DNA primase [Candidatus Fermentibacterales bacterium]